MVNVKIEESALLDLLMDRVEFWTKQKDTEYYLFEKMYENYIEGGCFDGMTLEIEVIVDNDYVNWCRVIYEGEEEYAELKKLFDEQGCGDVSCDTEICDYIEAYYDNAFLVR